MKPVYGMVGVRWYVSGGIYHLKKYSYISNTKTKFKILNYKVMELVGGGSVSNGATPSSFYDCAQPLIMYKTANILNILTSGWY